MPLVPQTYNRNLRSPKYYSTVVGSEGYNPTITIYYGADDNILRIEEVWRGKRYSQTVSGTNYVEQWPSYSYNVIYNAWEETTVS